jgi:PKD repeat protein
MREYFRPYNKVVTVADKGLTVVELTDSAAAPLACNYVSVTPVSGTATGGSMFQIVPSGINTIYGGVSANGGDVSSRNSGPSSYSNAVLRVSNNASGSLGLVADANGGTAILSLGPFDTTKALLLSHNSNDADPVTYSVTYGQVTLANSRADTWGINMEEVSYTSAIADFTYTTDGARTVYCTDTSQGYPIAWYWEFDVAGTPVTSNLQNPTHDFAAAGMAAGKQVRLTITTLHSASQGTANVVLKTLS